MKTQILVSTLTLITMFAFQNCGNQYAAASYKMAQSRGAALDPNKVQVGPSVWPRMDSTVANSVPLSVSQAALPLAVDFGANPDYQDDTASVTWGTWLSQWHHSSYELHSFLGQPRYLYRLDLFKSTVMNLTSDEVIYHLTQEEAAQVSSLLTGSILANAKKFSTCQRSNAPEYATLETDYGLFDLGAGAPCAVIDLFKNDGSGETAGFAAVLSDLQAKLQ